MAVVLLSIAIVALAMGAMAIGVAVSGRRLRGSCGGAGDCECERAGIRPDQRACARVP
jgi:hypothetical protein